MLKALSKIKYTRCSLRIGGPNTGLVKNKDSDYGYRHFISKVHRKVGIASTTSLAIAMTIGKIVPPEILCDIPVLITTMGSSLVMGLAGCYGIRHIEPIYNRVTINDTEIIESEDLPARKLSFYALVSAVGLSLSIPMSLYLSIDPYIVPISLGLSTLIFGGCAYVSRKISDVTLLKWKVPLYVGLSSLLGLQLVNLISYLCLGHTALNDVLSSIDIHAGLVLFTGLSIYDSYIAKEKYDKGKPDTLECTTLLYLDFVNILVRIMAILAHNRNDNQY